MNFKFGEYMFLRGHTFIKLFKFVVMLPEEIVQEGLKNIYTTIEPPVFRDQFAQVGGLMQEFTYLVTILKYFGIGLTIILVIFFIWFFIKTSRETKQKLIHLRDLINPPEPARGPIKARWEEVLRHLSSFREGEWKFAIVEADKLVNDVLRDAGFKGETIGEKLKAITTEQLQSINALWDAHKLRNLVVHDSDFKIKHREVRRAIEQYEKALRELHVLD